MNNASKNAIKLLDILLNVSGARFKGRQAQDWRSAIKAVEGMNWEGPLPGQLVPAHDIYKITPPPVTRLLKFDVRRGNYVPVEVTNTCYPYLPVYFLLGVAMPRIIKILLRLLRQTFPCLVNFQCNALGQGLGKVCCTAILKRTKEYFSTKNCNKFYLTTTSILLTP